MTMMFTAWMIAKRPRPTSGNPSTYTRSSLEQLAPLIPQLHSRRSRTSFGDFVNVDTVDLKRDEYEEDVETDRLEDEQRQRRETGRAATLWRLYYWVV